MLLVTPARACGLTARQPTAATPPASPISSAAHAASLERRHCRCAELWAARCHCQPCCQARGTCTTGCPACQAPTPLCRQGAGSILLTLPPPGLCPAGIGRSGRVLLSTAPGAVSSLPKSAQHRQLPVWGPAQREPRLVRMWTQRRQEQLLPAAITLPRVSRARSEEAALGALWARRRVAVLPVGGAVGMAVELRVGCHRSRGGPKAERVQPRCLLGHEGAGEVQLSSGRVKDKVLAVGHWQYGPQQGV